MSWVAQSGGAFVSVMLSTAVAYPQATDAPPSPATERAVEVAPSETAPVCRADGDEPASVEEFSKSVERHARVVELTRRLEERDRAAFERAVDRHAALVALTRRLEQAYAAEQRREFEERFREYVRKREFMSRLMNGREAPAPHVPAAPETWGEPRP